MKCGDHVFRVSSDMKKQKKSPNPVTLLDPFRKYLQRKNAFPLSPIGEEGSGSLNLHVLKNVIFHSLQEPGEIEICVDEKP